MDFFEIALGIVAEIALGRCRACGKKDGLMGGFCRAHQDTGPLVEQLKRAMPETQFEIID